MKKLLQLSVLLTGGLMVLKAYTADAPDRPIHVLYLGTVDARSGGGGFGGARTNYVYLPGQTLAPDAIYFDSVTSITNLTEEYLKHFDAVVQVMPDDEVVAARKMLDSFKSAGNALIKYNERPGDAVLREAVLRAISSKAKS